MAFKRTSLSSIRVDSATIAVAGSIAPSTTSAPLIAATGGTETTVGPYKVHTFNAGSGQTLSVTSGSLSAIEYLFLAGGGPAGRAASNGGGGGAGGLLMWWPGALTGQCVGPRLLVSSGDSLNITVGSGGTALDNNSINGCGNDTKIIKTSGSSTETHLVYGGGGGGGGTALFVGYNGGSGGGSIGAGNSGVNTWPTGGELTGEIQYQFNYGRASYPYKQGNGNVIKGNTGKSSSAGGAYTAGMGYIGLSTDTVRTNFPGIGVRTSWSGTFAEYGHGGKHSTANPTTGAVPTPSTYGSGGMGRNGTGLGGNGSDGIVIFKYLTNTTVAVSNLEVLIVGGGGGSVLAGGGGGGSVIYYGNEANANGGPITLYSGTYTVIVGGGGTRSNAIATQNPLGSTSSVLGIPTQYATMSNCFGGFDAYGGSSYSVALGDYWGSGCGATNVAPTSYGYGIPNPSHGNIGGQGNGGTPGTGGGGGGAGSAGGNSVNLTSGGNGGDGKQFSITGTATYYGGGGGGGKSSANNAGAGGQGGGGAGIGGTGAIVAGSGVANSGGGGGASTSTTATGGSGGSGVVVMRYPDSYPAATATTGSPTITLAGGWRTYIFTSSGTITF